MSQNPFTAIWSLGYERLVPIIPPDADLSPTSSLSKRKDARGKAVGVRGSAGQWYGFDWIPHESDEGDCARWHRMGAGCGVKTGRGLIAIDADTLDLAHAEIIRDLINTHLGDELPIRVGQYPKALYLCRTTDEYRYTRVEFGERREDGSLKDRVEILSDGRQFVAHGIHPKTRKPYSWPRALLPYADLPTFEPATIDALMAALQAALPSAPSIIREGASSDNVNQDALKGKFETVRKAVENTPNTSDHFPTRETYRDYGYAIKAALPDNEPAAYDLYLDWCLRWVEGENDPDIVAADWRRMKGPFKRGAGWLYELAEKYSSGKFTEAEAWFEPIPDDDNPFAELRRQDVTETSSKSPYPLITVDDLLDRPKPEWLIEKYLPMQGTGFVYAAPGAGKTFWVLDAMLSVSARLPDWHGNKINADTGLVLYIASEGSYGFRNRVKAWLTVRGKTPADVRAFKMIEKTINFLKGDDLERLVTTIDGALAPGVHLSAIVVDTVSRAIPGADENLQKDMSRFVDACDRVRDRYGCVVIGVHHAGKNGDMRGSTVFPGGGDFIFGLKREKGARIGRILCEKMKDAEDGWSANFRFDKLEMDDGESSLVVSASVDVGPSVEITPELNNMILAAMKRDWDKGDPWAKNARLKDRLASWRLVMDFGFSQEAAEKKIEALEAEHYISDELHSTKTRRRGFQVMVGVGQPVQSEGIFA